MVEYGSGGSTLLAARSPGSTILTTESDRAFLDRLTKHAVAERLPGEIVPLHCDIGPTGHWGHPRDASHWRKFPDYALTPWRYLGPRGASPDLVVIDGRFRVACFLATCVSIRCETEIFVDDYVRRPNYHVMEEVSTPREIVDDRMAVFRVERDQVTAAFLLHHLDVFSRPHH